MGSVIQRQQLPAVQMPQVAGVPAAPGAPAAPLLAPGAGPDAVEQLQRDVEGLQEEFRGLRVQTERDIDHISCVQACHGFVFCMLYMYVVYILHKLWFAH